MKIKCLIVFYVALKAVVQTRKLCSVITEAIHDIEDMKDFFGKKNSMLLTYQQLRSKRPNTILSENEFINLSSLSMSMLKTYYVRKFIADYMKTNNIDINIKYVNIAIELLCKCEG